MPLNDAACRAAKPRAKCHKLSDGGGLQLWVQPNGSKLWRLAYRLSGKQKLLAIGPYPSVGLAEARQKREEAKSLLRSNIDPMAAKRQAKQALAGQVTFSTVAEEYVGQLVRKGRASATIKKSEWVLRSAKAKFGARSLDAIEPTDVLEVGRMFEQRGNLETANRFIMTVGSVFRYAIASAYTKVDPTVGLKGAIARRKATPRAAITDPRALGPLLRAIDGYQGHPVVAAALRILPLVFVRPSELRLAEWAEFDLEAGLWTIPAARTKMRRELQVPLAPQVTKHLIDLMMLQYSTRLVFPSVRVAQKPISEGTMGAALRSLGYGPDKVTPHGFRATASTLLNQCGRWNPDAIERQLGHEETNGVRKAYMRAEFDDERRMMMAYWADYLDSLKQPPPPLALVRSHSK